MSSTSSFMSDDPNVVTHRTITSHWCADCWHWVVDCVHCVDPLRLPHRLAPKDTYVHRFAYDPSKRRLEVFHRWKSGTQYYPGSREMFQQLADRKNISTVTDGWTKARRVRWDEVRTERKIVASMLCGFRLVVERMLKDNFR